MATIVQRGDKFYCQIRRKGFPSIGKTFSTYEDAEKFASDVENELINERDNDLFSAASHNIPVTKFDLKLIYKSSVKRAKGCNREHSISETDIFDLYEEQNGCCAVSGLPFSSGKNAAWRIQPFYPSLDRIDSKVGYTKDNVRLVCAAVNLALNDWGEDVLRLIAMGVTSNSILMNIKGVYGNIHSAQQRLVSSG